MRFKYLVILTLVFMLVLTACAQPTEAPAPAAEEPAAEEPMEEEPAAEEPAEEPMEEAPAVTELNILWAQWDPADQLQQTVDQYEDIAGVKVNVIQEPWGSFGDRFFTEMAAGGDAWDMVIGDSQWLGQGATQGHYVEMTDFLTETGIKDSVTPATLTYYGEYPTGSGQYWAYPTEGDADGWAYRKDLFEDPDNMAAFEEEYGYPLDVPKTYDELWDIANFFTNPDDGMYGVAIYTQKDYDAITMGVENTMFSWGGEWADENNNVMGIVNSPENIESVQFYRDLYECCQVPGLSNAFFTETNDAMIGGQAAMAMNYFAFFPALASPEINPYADVTGYFPNPAGPGGAQHAALGGQGMSIISYISDERKQAAMDFIEWYSQDDIQAQFAALGGYSTNNSVVESDEFLNAAPFNPAFAETMTFVKDFWNIPEYGELLEVTQRLLSQFIVEGVGTAEDTMNQIAEEHDAILRDAGYIE